MGGGGARRWRSGLPAPTSEDADERTRGRDDLEADERRETRGARSSVTWGKGGGGGDPRRTRRVSFWRVGDAASDLTRPVRSDLRNARVALARAPRFEMTITPGHLMKKNLAPYL